MLELVIMENMGRPSLSFVIPLKDESVTLKPLFDGIAAEAKALGSRWEVIFIDDGSSDESWNIITNIAAEFPQNAKAIRFRRNFGKADALATGWKEANGDFVFTMDADLQDDPKEISRFLEKMEEGFDIVTGWKRTRHDPWHKVLPSRIFNFLLSRVNKVELHDHNCGFKCYRQNVVKSLSMYGEMHRMVPSLALIEGFRTAEIPVEHRARQYGKSKYGLKRFLRGFLDMWTVWYLGNFRQRPIHLMGAISLLMLAGAFGMGLLLTTAPPGSALAMTFSTAISVLAVGGLGVFIMGLNAEWQLHQHNTESARSTPIAQTIGLSDSVTFASASSAEATALIVEDDPAMLKLNALHLQEAGYRVLTAASCEEGRAKLGESIDLVLLDLNLPDGNGLSLVESIHRMPHSPEIIFLSSETDVSTGVEAMRLGAFDYLCKPVQAAKLVGVALRALKQRRRLLAGPAAKVEDRKVVSRAG
jgi:glycosyltransferase involved in cell wall biosynthesis/ActR/RegA family two-component response regulator